MTNNNKLVNNHGSTQLNSNHPPLVVAALTGTEQNATQLSTKMVSGLINANPIIYEKKQRRARTAPSLSHDDYAVEPIDQQEVFDILFLISI